MTFPSHLVSEVPSTLQAVQSSQHVFNTFCRAEQAHEHLRNLQETVSLLKSVQKEIEEIFFLKGSNSTAEGYTKLCNNSQEQNSPSVPCDSSPNATHFEIINIIKEKKVCPDVQESLTLEAAKSLVVTLKGQLAPFNAIISQASQWEERSMVVKLAQQQRKHMRNKLWKKRKRKHAAELLRKEHEGYDKADQEADEWRAREIAKSIAKRKMEIMKSIAKRKAVEERKRLESELELFLAVEKLQELRSIRIQKLKKQGHFLPEEDDKFMELVRAATEEEERQAGASTEILTSRDTISADEKSRNDIQSTITETNKVKQNKVEVISTVNEQKIGGEEFSSSSYELVANLPFEFYHYYHGSNHDMGTLIEVRRIWDAYIRPGGSRIPGHWVQPPPPADEIWSSYLVGPKSC